MYSKRPHIVIGFHGCAETSLDTILNHKQEMKKSTQDHDWLGEGMYFWENNYERALEWSKTKHTNPAVLGALIDLGQCLDFIDSR